MNVCIIGSGPAGLMAAQACLDLGVTYKVLSMRVEPSKIAGTQHMQWLPPSLISRLPMREMLFMKHGEEGIYAEKSFGHPDAPSGWSKIPVGTVPTWSMRGANELLWSIHEERVEEAEIKPDYLPVMVERFQLVVLAAPLLAFCLRPDQHSFRRRITWMVSRDSGVPERPDLVVYNGDPESSFYRFGITDGIENFEMGEEDYIRACKNGGPPLGLTDWRKVVRPLNNNCRCHPSVIRAGRMGRWRFGVLAHEAYAVTRDALMGV